MRPGEVSLDELERAFRETAVDVAPAAAEAPALSAVETPHEATAAVKEPRASRKMSAGAAETDSPESDRVANQSIRVNVDTLE